MTTLQLPPPPYAPFWDLLSVIERREIIRMHAAHVCALSSARNWMRTGVVADREADMDQVLDWFDDDHDADDDDDDAGELMPQQLPGHPGALWARLRPSGCPLGASRSTTCTATLDRPEYSVG